jgi:hypothetical protein
MLMPLVTKLDVKMIAMGEGAVVVVVPIAMDFGAVEVIRLRLITPEALGRAGAEFSAGALVSSAESPMWLGPMASPTLELPTLLKTPCLVVAFGTTRLLSARMIIADCASVRGAVITAQPMTLDTIVPIAPIVSTWTSYRRPSIFTRCGHNVKRRWLPLLAQLETIQRLLNP